MDDLAMKYAEETAEIVVQRVELAMVRHPGSTVENVYKEIEAGSHLGPMTRELARMKLGIF